MKHQNDTKIYLFYRLVLTIMTTFFATTSIAAWNNSTDTSPDFVDSVHKWGAWELDIEPAAGGLQQASTPVVNPRDSRASLRINSVSALSPSIPTPAAAIPAVPAVPAVPATPTTPAIPAVPARPAAPTMPAPPGATPPVVVILP